MDESCRPIGETHLVPGIHPPGFAPVTEETLAEIVRRVVIALCPQKVILFGSYAYGTPSDDSDVDLLIIMETDARPVDRYLAVSCLIRPRPFPLDLLVKTPDEISQALEKNNNFIRELISRGRILYERPD